MKFLVFLAGLLFFVMYVSFDTSNCDACSFDGKNIDKFMEQYSNNCFLVDKELIINISNYNPKNQDSKSPN